MTPTCENPTYKKALFLDRDGVICRALPRKQYVLSNEQFTLLPEIRDVIRRAKSLGYLVVVVTNQPQVAYGMLGPAELDGIHKHMHTLLEGTIDAVYACPHEDHDLCECRKPKPGLFRQAIRDLGIDPSRSVMIGDSDTDIEAARSAGCGMALLFRTEGHTTGPHGCASARTISDLLEALPFLR